MTDYVRPESLEQAFSLLSEPGALPLAGGTDLLGQIDRGIVEPSVLVDISRLGPEGIRSQGAGLALAAGITLAEIAASESVTPYGAVASAAAQAASSPLRNIGTLGGNLCQGTRCWYFRGQEWHCWLGGGETCYAQIGDHRKHNLQAGDCISAHPSDLAPALAACGAEVVVQSAHGSRTIALAELYRRPTAENRSLLTLAGGEIVTDVHLPEPPEASSYQRLGERAAFSFPLVSVAAARRSTAVTVFANGVANIPLRIDPDDPLAELPGNPQTMWKRTALKTLVERALADLD